MSITSMTRSHTIDIYELTTTKDAAGSSRKTVGDRLRRNVACRKVTLTSEEQLEYEKKGIVTDTVFQFATDPDIDQNKIIRHGANYYRFSGVHNKSELGVLYVVLTQYRANIDS